MAKRPVSAIGNRRPVAEYARLGSITGNPRFKGENILQLHLDMPTRTTSDYEGPIVAPRVQAALDAALKMEQDIDIIESPALNKMKAKKKDKLPKESTPKVFMTLVIVASFLFIVFAI